MVNQCPNSMTGHNYKYPNIYSASVPFIFQKTKYMDSVLNRFEENKDKLYSTEDFIHSICDLSKINGDYIDTQKSIFSKNYKEIKRMVGDETNFDDLLKNPCGTLGN